MTSRPVAEIIDDLLTAMKEISGVPDWRRTEDDPGELRLLMPITINGASTGSHLEIKAYPNMRPLRYGMLFIFERCVSRIDWVTDENHVNSFNRPHDLHEHQFFAPHYHSWPDNRRFCTRNSLPDRLENARILPDHVQGFDNVFRWFCAELNIEQPPNGLISLPNRTTLL